MVSPIKLKDFLAYLGRFAPWELAESWDNVGLMIGNPDQEITGLLIALDPTLQILEEAILKKANTILTHHPLIFHPLKAINTATPSGRFLQKALCNNIAVVSCHTNLDIISEGVSAALAHALCLNVNRPLKPSGSERDHGFGRIGSLPEPMSGEDFLLFAAEQLRLQGFTIAGPLPEIVSSIAVCGGSGSDFASDAFFEGVDIYITAEVKHSVARWAEENKFCIIDAGHFPTENVIIHSLLERIAAFFAENNNPAPVFASEIQDSPLRFHISDYMYTKNLTE